MAVSASEARGEHAPIGEGIVSGHPVMSIFAFSRHDIEAIIEYLESIQVQQHTL